VAPGQFVYADLLVPQALSGPPPVPDDAPTAGRWIDVNLTFQVATAYEGTQVVRTTRVSAGRPGWETPTGTHQVLRRVERDTMDGASLVGQGPNGQGAKYHIDDVGFVQYFTADGAAIHANTWRNPASFGVPGSHGCIGMLPADAQWFWRWMDVGTTLLVHQ
jgi:lipoprotein-anchoring transpeptidase ErfK/SrfK